MTAAHQIIDRLSRLLHDEVAAISAGQLETVRELYPQKLALFEELQAASDGIETKLRQEGGEAGELRTQLEKLHGLVRKDFALLEQMTAATERAARELARIRDRHGLGGIYESSGTLRKDDVALQQQIDQSI